MLLVAAPDKQSGHFAILLRRLILFFYFLQVRIVLIDLDHVDINESEGMVLATGYALDLKEAHLGALSETLQHFGRGDHFVTLIAKSAVAPIAPAKHDLVLPTYTRPS